MTRYPYIVKDNNFFIAAGRHTLGDCREFIKRTAETDAPWAATFSIWKFDPAAFEYFFHSRPGTR
jgi:hypothetical protein